MATITLPYSGIGGPRTITRATGSISVTDHNGNAHSIADTLAGLWLVLQVITGGLPIAQINDDVATANLAKWLDADYTGVASEGTAAGLGLTRAAGSITVSADVVDGDGAASVDVLTFTDTLAHWVSFFGLVRDGLPMANFVA